MKKNIFILIIKFVAGLIINLTLIFTLIVISELVKDQIEKHKWLRINTEKVNGVFCVKKGGSYKNKYGLECCPGLKAIDEDSTVVKDYPYDVGYGQICTLHLYGGGTFVCTTCGDGLCEDKENSCNCSDDCANNESAGE